uniref:Cysteine and histidine-rich domain-containing protein 1-like n=1 Tax=Phallusia mammillata TaxID=59560 RepID=A0A6F9D9X5_9ASCI|nr:cysteine and histidine-rich domain-containing protein 1-like [Phallusia mammillata]
MRIPPISSVPLNLKVPFQSCVNSSIQVRVWLSGASTYSVNVVKICDWGFDVTISGSNTSVAQKPRPTLYWKMYSEPKALANKTIPTTTPSVPQTLQTGSMTIPSSSTPTASFTFPFNTTLDKSVKVMVTAPGLPKHTFNLKVTKVCDSNFTVQVKRTDLPSGWNQSFPLYYEVFSGNREKCQKINTTMYFSGQKAVDFNFCLTEPVALTKNASLSKGAFGQVVMRC